MTIRLRVDYPDGLPDDPCAWMPVTVILGDRTFRNGRARPGLRTLPGWEFAGYYVSVLAENSFTATIGWSELAGGSNYLISPNDSRFTNTPELVDVGFSSPAMSHGRHHLFTSTQWGAAWVPASRVGAVLDWVAALPSKDPNPPPLREAFPDLTGRRPPPRPPAVLL